ncbi:hypothetical protein B0H17DRAFT_1125595 [Mycena rosella]|uniref:Uncharacterized protein n=1 Tax=Mycena rosella TaxID=1033263 RepID=A0AAD7GWT2_MYCRO|nr:hypothetical protein B0H17DRAFT_1125595 [Mycena rosella]
MGRRAKHLTSAEQASANRERVQKYSSTPSGKAARALARRTRYISHTTRKESKHPRDIPLPFPTSILGLPPLGIEIEQMYTIPLPEAHHFFRDALTKPGSLEESDLHRWKAEPPFFEDEDMTDPYSTNYLRFTDSLASVLHGVRLREQNKRDIERRVEFYRDGRPAALVRLRTEVADLLSGWERVKALDIYHEYHNSREHTMHQHYLQWQARTIYHLYHLKFLD